MRYLPRWKDEWSDGCSHVEDICKGCCIRHDEKYYFGGSEQDRLKADKEFLLCMIDAGMPKIRAYTRYFGVRFFGGPEWKEEKVSWSFGGSYFKYSDLPALPIDEAA